MGPSALQTSPNPLIFFCHICLTTENVIASQEGFGGASKQAENLQALGAKKKKKMVLENHDIQTSQTKF